jgi:hypothetical protein
MPMNPEIKKKWVDALRSGKYKQGRDGLHDRLNNTFCCLGVLCDVEGLESVHDPESRWARYIFDNHDDRKSSVVTLHNSYRDKIHIMPSEVCKLVDMNDRGVPFHEIADYIEENL